MGLTLARNRLSLSAAFSHRSTTAQTERTPSRFMAKCASQHRRSLLITSNLVFSEWDRIFRNPMTTAAAIDRLVHHSVILEFNVKSYRSDKAQQRAEAAAEAPQQVE